MRQFHSLFAAALFGVALVPVGAQSLPAGGTMTPIRPPATPLIVRQPYVSTWQPADALPGTWPAFWTGGTKAMTGIARIDGKPYIFLGNPRVHGQPVAPPMTQTALNVTPTQSEYTFQDAGVTVALDFLSPVYPHDLRRQSVPLGYIFADARSADGKPHTVSLYFDISGEWASGDPKTPITWRSEDIPGKRGGLKAFVVRSATPKPLGEIGDYPTWGRVLWATAARPGLTEQSGAASDVRALAAAQGQLDDTTDKDRPRAINDHSPVFAFDFDLGRLGKKTPAPVVLTLGDVRDPSVSYLGQPVPPLWKSYWPTWEKMLAFFGGDAATERGHCDTLDRRITVAAVRAGGPHYAALCALALRQAFGATELVGTRAKPWMFLKEISSDGNVSTVDVEYPSFPVFLYTNPDLLRLQLAPLLAYAETGGWPKPFAEHDIGASYPNASGHNDGKEEDMPVEESANMLIMAAAYMRYASAKDAAAYARRHDKILKQWADYLLTVPAGATAPNALDPQYQNQTDDFTGQIAHSVNLALKGILGVGAMGQIAAYAGDKMDAAYYSQAALQMSGQWARMAQNKDGTHLLLTYKEPGVGPMDTSSEADTAWSLKYNAFPDKVLGLGLIPQSLLQEEAKFYLTQVTPFGVPLDMRHTYTKTDWELWTAASTDDPALRQAFVDGIYHFADTSKARVPFSDWYDTASGQQVGFQARPVIGGVFAILDRTALKPNK